MMEPFYFGPESRRLFGVYHPPACETMRRVGVILCHPAGQEYIRAHRAFLQLARLLAERGFFVLRFDYYGCGDSMGDCDQGTSKQWIADISTAVEELRNTGVEQMALVGLRWGATLALLCGAERDDVAALVSWEPVMDGAEYLRELHDAHHVWLAGSFARPKRSEVHTDVEEVLGFPISDLARPEYLRCDLRAMTRRPASRVLVVEKDSGAQFGHLAEHLKTIGAEVSHIRMGYPRIWEKADDPEAKGLVPVEVLHSVTAWMSEVFP